MSEKEYDIELNYDKLANHIFTSLVELAYAPAEDELLDITDIVYEFILDMFEDAGIEIIDLADIEGDDD